MPSADFAGAIKGMKNLDSMKNAVDAELARAKIAASEIADRIQLNLKALGEHQNQAFLFFDEPALVLKAPDDLRAIITARIAEHQAKEQARLDAERARIRSEEEAKARAEQERQRAAEAAELRRIHVEQQDRERQALVTSADRNKFWADGETKAEAPASTPRAPAVDPSAVVIITGEPTINLGAINARLRHITITADGLRALGIPPAMNVRSSVLYRAASFPKICNAIVHHVLQAKAAYEREQEQQLAE
jgi:hypothetical protein